jgi:hemoglobin
VLRRSTVSPSVQTHASLFARLGGESAVEAAVVRFYEKVMADPGLARFFVSLDLDGQIRKQIQFLTYALGGPTPYTGRDLRTAHAGSVRRGLSHDHFVQVARLLTDTLTELDVEPPLIEEVMGIVASTHDDVLNK